jgi:hypothetical protein
LLGLGCQLLGGHRNELRLAGTLFGEAQHFVADSECLHARPDLGDNAGQVAALTGRERSWKEVLQRTRTDLRLAGINPGGLHLDEHLALSGHRTLDLAHLEDVDTAVVIESHCLIHENYDNHSPSTIPGQLKS